MSVLSLNIQCYSVHLSEQCWIKPCCVHRSRSPIERRSRRSGFSLFTECWLASFFWKLMAEKLTSGQQKQWLAVT